MTERGLPIVDGAPACPFVAFDDDRDERASSPDHRHRCFAESPPAPRALAHQEAYCLSSAFPVCPTFQDWARREAARARDAEPTPIEEEDEPVEIDRPPHRSGSSTWSAPPPWLRGDAAGGSSGTEGPDEVSREPGFAADAGLAAGAAAAGAASGLPAIPVSEPEPPAGLSGSFADRLASGQPPEEIQDRSAQPGAPAGAAGSSLGVAPSRHRERWEAGGGWDDEARDQSGRERDAAAPAWERPRRLEAYPTVRSRQLSGFGLPSLLIAVVAVALAAILLFFLPSLLGIGGGPSTPTPSPSGGAAASTSPSESAGPTGIAVPTPFFYTVVQGDTMTKIAKKFGIPLGTLIDANKDTVPNPDKLKVGDRVIIPVVTPTGIPGASASP